MDANYSTTKDRKQNYMRRGLATLLVASMPFVMGQGDCETTNIDDVNAVLYDNLSRNTKDPQLAGAYRSISTISAIEGQRTYQNRQNELNRQATIEAANIRAEAERDAARIRANADRDVAERRNNTTSSEEMQIPGIVRNSRGGFALEYEDANGSKHIRDIPESNKKLNDDDMRMGNVGKGIMYQNKEKGLYIVDTQKTR